MKRIIVQPWQIVSTLAVIEMVVKVWLHMMSHIDAESFAKDLNSDGHLQRFVNCSQDRVSTTSFQQPVLLIPYWPHFEAFYAPRSKRGVFSTILVHVQDPKAPDETSAYTETRAC